MMRLTIGIGVVLCACALRADLRSANTDWMVGKVGAFMHYWPKPENWPKPETIGSTADFDVPRLKEQLVEMGVDYFIITLGQNDNTYIAPNAAYPRIAGEGSPTVFSRRDIPAEIIRALKGTGIRFGLYSPCQPPMRDEVAERNFGFEPITPGKIADWRMTDRGAANWAKVVGEWAERYGEDVAIWWFDGARPDMGFTEAHGRMLRDALRKGNPKMAISFNYGLLDWAPAAERAYGVACERDPGLAERVPFREFRSKMEGMGLPADERDRDNPMKWTGGYLEDIRLVRWTEAADYTSGEVAEPFRFMPGDRWFDGAQHHVLTYLGHYWGERHCRYPDEIWIRFLREYLAKGGCISIDMSVDRKPGSIRFAAAHVNQMRRILRAVRTCRP